MEVQNCLNTYIRLFLLMKLFDALVDQLMARQPKSKLPCYLQCNLYHISCKFDCALSIYHACLVLCTEKTDLLDVFTLCLLFHIILLVIRAQICVPRQFLDLIKLLILSIKQLIVR